MLVDVVDVVDGIDEISINELKGTFVIPRYQRGYRWETENIERLISDLNDFYKSSDSDDKRYSLQPIVINKREDNKNYVIDGQQRLTTIWLLNKYFGNKTFDLEYEVDCRKDAIKRINRNTKKIDESDADSFHLTNAYLCIKDTFEKDNDKRDRINKQLCENGRLGLIWYEPCKNGSINDEIDVFTRFNKGKIPLTDGELVKALFLLSKTFNQEFNDEDIKYKQRVIAEKWDEIENRLQDNDFWYFIHNDESGDCIKDSDTRIDYILSIYLMIKVLKDVQEKYKKEKSKTKKKKSKTKKDKSNLEAHEELIEKIKKDVIASYTEKLKGDNALFNYYDDIYNVNKEKFIDIWERIVDIYYTFDEWYNDLELYHRIGFLIEEKGNAIYELASLYYVSKKINKEDLKKYVIDNIKSKYKKEMVEAINERKVYEISSKDKNAIQKRKTRPILLLYNIETIIKEQNNNDHQSINDFSVQEFNRFSFYRFKKEEWDIEHINPATDKDKYTNTEREQIIASLYDLSKGDCGDLLEKDQKKNIKKCYEFIIDSMNSKGNGLTDNQKEEIDDTISDILNKDSIFTEEEKNRISNYCLLNADINRAYGNALFATKREWIISKDQGYFNEFVYDNNGAKEQDAKKNKNEFKKVKKDCKSSFIPVCTKKVFMKYYSTDYNDLFKWTKKDAENYLKDIKETLEKYMN